jgi:hypothetical protein
MKAGDPFTCRICLRPSRIGERGAVYCTSLSVCHDCQTDVHRLSAGEDYGLILKLVERIAALEAELWKTP